MPYHLATAPHDFYIITYVSNKIKLKINDPTGNRTRVTAVKGPCLNRLTIGPYFFKSSPSRIRTNDPPVNSRMLYRWAIEDYTMFESLHLQNRIQQTLYHKIFIRSSPRSISIGQLNTLPCLHLQPIYLIIFKGSYFRRMGNLILRAASRLDAFSVYPFHT